MSALYAGTKLFPADYGIGRLDQAAICLCLLQAKGGAFTGESKDFFHFVVGKGEVIPGFEEAVKGMKVGGIRRIIVPPELGYPDNDYNKQGPKPTNFSVS